MTSAILILLGIYLAGGLVFAIAFVCFGAGRIDPHARQGTWGFRLLIIPGAAALWPLLVSRWLRGVPAPPEQRDPHRRAAVISKPGRHASNSP